MLYCMTRQLIFSLTRKIKFRIVDANVQNDILTKHELDDTYYCLKGKRQTFDLKGTEI